MKEDFEEECVWFPYTVVAIYPEGELREQRWFGRDANHVLERVFSMDADVVQGTPKRVKAARVWED